MVRGQGGAWLRGVTRTAALGAAGAAALLATGCTPAIEGATGLTLDAERRPIALFAGCGREVSVVSIEDVTYPENGYVPIGRWRPVKPAAKPGVLRLVMPDPGVDWLTVVPLGPMLVGQEFDLGGAIGSDPAGPVLASVRFKVTDWGQLGPGKVLMGRDDTPVGQSVVTESEFLRRACDPNPPTGA